MRSLPSFLAAAVLSIYCAACTAPPVKVEEPKSVPNFLLLDTYQNGEKTGHCTGSAVAKNVVLTAEHCLRDTDTWVVAGKQEKLKEVIKDGHDHALLIFEEGNFVQIAKFHTSEKRQGAHYFVSGYPGNFHHLYREGVYSGKDDGLMGQGLDDYYEITIYPGDSGGGIYDVMTNELVGVVSYAASANMSTGQARIQFAVSVPFGFTEQQICHALYDDKPQVGGCLKKSGLA